MRRAWREAFTLIELAVVCALMVILAALLFPVFGMARARALQATCVSHLAQIGRAGVMYLSDYDERFPSVYLNLPRTDGTDLDVALQSYLRHEAVFYCPNRRTMRADCFDPTDRLGVASRCRGYGYNWGSGTGPRGSPSKGDGLVRPGLRVGTMVGVLLAEVAQPSRCFLAGDTNDHYLLSLWRDAMPGVHGEGVAGQVSSTGINAAGHPYEPPRHGGGNCFVFVDGHVQWLRFPGGRWIDEGPRVVSDMSMYSRTGQWEAGPVP